MAHWLLAGMLLGWESNPHCLIKGHEGNDFPNGLMVIKGEYLTQDPHAQKKKGYVFEDYRLGQIV